MISLAALLLDDIWDDVVGTIDPEWNDIETVLAEVANSFGRRGFTVAEAKCVRDDLHWKGGKWVKNTAAHYAKNRLTLQKGGKIHAVDGRGSVTLCGHDSDTHWPVPAEIRPTCGNCRRILRKEGLA